MKYVSVRAFDNSIEASLARDKLMNSGIHCFVTNENVTSLLPTLNFIHGGGVHLMVDREDLEKANEALREDHSDEVGTDGNPSE